MQTNLTAIQKHDATLQERERQRRLPDHQYHAYIVVQFESLTKDVLPRLEVMMEVIPDLHIDVDGVAESPQPTKEELQFRDDMGMTQVHQAVLLKKLERGQEVGELNALLEMVKVIMKPIELRYDQLEDQAIRKSRGTMGRSDAVPLVNFDMPKEEAKPPGKK